MSLSSSDKTGLLSLCTAIITAMMAVSEGDGFNMWWVGTFIWFLSAAISFSTKY